MGTEGPAKATGTDSLLLDGRIVHLRSATTDDEPQLLDLFARASQASRYLRFFSAGVSGASEVRRLLHQIDDDHVRLVAEHANTIVGVASYDRLDDDEADIAIFVADLWQSEGVGTLLLEQLAAAARRVGIRQLAGDVLARNSRMLEVGSSVAPNSSRSASSEPETLRIRIPTLPDAAALTAAGFRDRTAERRSLARLMAPNSVAVIGASRRAGSVGHEVVTALISAGFSGPIYPVNPHAKEICGLPSVPSIKAVDQRVDLAVIAVPQAAVREVVDQCGTAQVGAAVVLTAGLADTGVAEIAAEAELVRLARRHGTRLLGPNCLGLINTDPAVRLAATFASRLPPAGHLAVASQSGAVGIAILDAAAASGVGVSSFVSLGNKADVSTNDLLAYWYDDPATSVVALYVESFGNPRRFAGLAQSLARRKPVLAVKSGRSYGGRRAGASHTAAAVVPDLTVDSLFRQAGVIRTDTLGEMLDAARLLTTQPIPTGARLGIVGNAGGLNVLAADAAQGAGLSVPELSGGLQQLLAGPSHAAGLGNPVDLGAEATPEDFATALRLVGGSGEVDALAITFVATRANDVAGCLDSMTTAVDQLSETPVAVVVVGADTTPSLGVRRVPVYGMPEDAIRALGHACRYAAWRRAPIGSRPQLTGVNPHRARALVAEALSKWPGWQPPDVWQPLLASYGITTIPSTLALDAGSAQRAASDLGFPVAVKAALPDLVHKSDIGAVVLGITGPDAVVEAYAAVAAAVGQPNPPVLVQPMARPGVELAAGIVHDPLFGSLVSLRAGGTATDLFPDTALRLLPLTDIDAAEMWQGLSVAPLLRGHRGRPSCDTATLEELLLRLGRLAEDRAEIAELDLNPVTVSSDGVQLVDVKLKLTGTGMEPDPYLRSLSQPFAQSQ